MYAITRHATVTSVDEVVRRVSEDYIPNILTGEPGFIELRFVKISEQELMGLVFFETREQADNSNRALRDWIQQHAADLIIHGPEITVGEVLINKIARPRQFPEDMAA